MKRQSLQLPIDIFGFKMAKLSALKIFEFPPQSLNLKISAIIKATHKFSVIIRIVTRERKVSQISYLGPSFHFMKK